MICVLCGSSEKNDIEYGEFLRNKTVSVHYYCLLLTTIMEQNGDDDDGIRGFLLPDILDCASKSIKKKCTYCRNKGANIACCNRKCYRFFHTVCGAKNNARYSFHDTYQSFCHQHIDLPEDNNPHGPEELCNICCDEMGQYHPLRSIRTPCCSSGWFHRICLAQSALSAGYFFKCPLCNEEKKFRRFLIDRNVFIPDRDASWEVGPQAFAELERKVSCSAPECRCPSGRKTNESYWKMKICKVCGSSGIHVNCNKSFTHRSYTCDDCNATLQLIVKQKNGESSSQEVTDSYESSDTFSRMEFRPESRASINPSSSNECNTVSTENKENDEEIPMPRLRSGRRSMSIMNNNNKLEDNPEHLPKEAEDDNVSQRILRSRMSSMHPNDNVSLNIEEQYRFKKLADDAEVPKRTSRSRKSLIIDQKSVQSCQDQDKHHQSEISLKRMENDNTNEDWLHCAEKTTEQEQQASLIVQSESFKYEDESHAIRGKKNVGEEVPSIVFQSQFKSINTGEPLQDTKNDHAAKKEINGKISIASCNDSQRCQSDNHLKKKVLIQKSITDYLKKETNIRRVEDNNKNEEWYVAQAQDSTSDKLSPTPTSSTATLNSISSEGKSPILSKDSRFSSEKESRTSNQGIPKLILKKRSRSLFESDSTEYAELSPTESMILDKRTYVSSESRIKNRKRRRILSTASETSEEDDTYEHRGKSLRRRSQLFEVRVGSETLAEENESSDSEKDQQMPIRNNLNRPSRRAALISRIRTFKMNRDRDEEF